MVNMVSQVPGHQQVLEIGGKRWFLAEKNDLAALRRKRSWDVDWEAEQGVDRRRPFVLDLDDFARGYGFSHANTPGVYQSADGWDLSTPGKARTWPVLNNLEAFDSVSDYRGWIVDHGGYVYVLRGRYVAKYAVSNTPGVESAVLGFHQIGSGMVVAGEPAIWGGDLYVPIVQLSDDVLQRFHRLSTVSTDVAEVQTIIISGTPTGGTYTVSYNDGVATYTTAAIAYNADQTAVQAALRLLPGLSKITVVTTGSTPNFTHTVTMTAAPGALGTTSPPQFTSNAASLTGGAPVISHATTVAGTVDQWDLGPASREARCFVVWEDTLVRADGNTVSRASTDPMTAGNWGAEYPVGDSGRNITQMSTIGSDLACGKPDGLWTFDENAKARHEIDDLQDVVDDQNTIGMHMAHAALFIPHRAGFLRWRPGAFSYVGAEQEGYLEGDATPHWGRVMGVAPYGKTIYYSINDTTENHGIVASLTPGAGRLGGYIPHNSHHFAYEIEHCAIVSLSSSPPASASNGVCSDDNAVGTVAWSNPTNATANDGTYATATAGTTHYLKALLPAATRVPTGATVLGVEVTVDRKSTGPGANFAFIATDDAWGPTARKNVTIYSVESAGSVVDNVVKLVRGGSVVGDNKADTSTLWPVADASVTYGGSADMWGTTLTPAQVNANDFGVVISASVTTGTAYVDGISISIYYEVSGAGDPGSYLAVIEIDAAHTSTTTRIIKLGRAGLAPANDPNVNKAASDVEFETPRYYSPERSVSKIYRAVTLWTEFSPASNIPGLKVWASVDDGAEVQLQDSTGAAATITTEGAQRLFFPKTSAAVGHYVAFRFEVPATAGAEQDVEVTVRDIKAYGVYQPVMTPRVEMVLVARQGAHSDAQLELRTPDGQISDMEDLVKPRSAPTPYKDPQTGEEGYLDLDSMHIEEYDVKEGQQSKRFIVASAKILGYS